MLGYTGTRTLLMGVLSPLLARGSHDCGSPQLARAVNTIRKNCHPVNVNHLDLVTVRRMCLSRYFITSEVTLMFFPGAFPILYPELLREQGIIPFE